MRRGDIGLYAGARVGRYRLMDPLGEGAMGRVWRAEGPSGPAAIKLLSAEGVGGAYRIELQARALLKLRHRNVVRAIDYGLMDGTPFIALELLEGESLEERLMRQRRVPIAEALRMAAGAAEGLAAAHALGIVHRDVKPGNIYLCRDGTTKVLDFGIAFWSAGDGRLPVSRLTEPGTVMGTPSYMAPEQAAGERDEDERTDVWGLGAVLYDAIAGREPFQAGDNYLAELTRILTEPPDPLPADVPRPVANLILRALEKPRERRFASMTAVARALRALEGAPIAGERPAQVDPVVMGALADEMRLVSAVLFEGLVDGAGDHFNEALRRHGAVGSPVRGQQAVAIFGGDAWLGDEAERAVKMALSMRGHVERVAIGTGKALRRLDQHGLVTGQVIGAAQKALRATDTDVPTMRPVARDESERRPPAPIIVCPETQRRLLGGFDLVGDRVVALREGGRVLRPREVGGREVPFVGRQEELDQMANLVDEVEGSGQARAVIISGSPGIGKSRLRYELLRRIDEEGLHLRQLEARGDLSHGRSSLGVLRELLRSEAGLPEGTAPDRSQARIGALVRSAGLTGEAACGIADFIGELLGVPFPDNAHLAAARSDPQMMADRIRLACGELFEAWTKQSLLLVSIEDAQWADDASLAFLDSLLEQLAARPLVVVATARPNFFVEHEALASADRIELGELRSEHTAAIVERVLGHAEAAVVERAAGNPYLAEELSLAVREGADPEALPLTVQGAVLARLDKLAPDEKDLLKRAAVLGRRFWPEALEALGEPLAGELLVSLRRRELVVPHAESRLHGCEEWIFRQDVIHEVCGGLLTDEQRRALHRAAGSWLSRRLDAAPHEVAEHFERAGEMRRAALWWLRALHGAHARGDSRNVTRFGRRVLSLEGVTLPVTERMSIHLLRCEAWFWLGERERLEEELHQAGELAEEGDALAGPALAQLRCWQAVHVQQAGHLEAALFAACKAAELADAAGALELRVQARSTQCSLLASTGSLEEAARVAAEALEIAKQGEGSLIRATAARALADVEARRGRLSSSLFYYSMARNLCVEVGALREATLDGIGVGAGLSVVGDYEQAQRMLEKTLRSAETLALGAVVGWVKHHLSLVKHRLGHTEAAVALQEAALSLGEELGDVHLVVAALQHGAIVAQERGDPKAALARAERALTSAQRHHKRTEEPLSRTLRAQALSALGRHEEALAECARASEARDAMGGMLHSEVQMLLVRYDASKALGRADQATATLRAARRCFQARLSTIDDERMRQHFSERVPAHARLARLLESDAEAAQSVD